MKINKFGRVLALSTLALVSTLGTQSFAPAKGVFRTTDATLISGVNWKSSPTSTSNGYIFGESSLLDLNTSKGVAFALNFDSEDAQATGTIAIGDSSNNYFEIGKWTASESGVSFTNGNDLTNLGGLLDDTNYDSSNGSGYVAFLFSFEDEAFASIQDPSFYVLSPYSDNIIGDPSGVSGVYQYDAPTPLESGGTQTIYTNVDNPISYEDLKGKVSAQDLFGADVAIDWPTDSGYEPETLGTYDIPISATDSYGQTATATVIVVVEDITAPTISLASGASLSYDTSTNATLDFDTLANKFTISDNASDNGGSIGTPTFKLDGTSLTADKTFGASDVGSHTLTVTVADSSGNTALQDFTITVVDAIAPVIAFKDGSALDTKITAGVSDTFDSDFASSAIVSLLKATDDVDEDVSTSLSVSFPDGFNNVGDHTITVSAKDSAGNVATQTFTLEVSQDVPPVFIFDESLILTTADSPLSASDLTATIASAYKSTYSTINSIVLDDEDVANYTENANKVGDYPIAFTINALNANGSVEEMNSQMTVRVLASTSSNVWDKIVAYHQTHHWLYWIEGLVGLALIALIIWAIARKKR